LDACYGDNHASNWPATIWLHIFQGDPTLGALELTGGGYAAVSASNDSASYPDAAGGSKSTGVDFDFATSTGPWSAPGTYWYFTDSATSLLPPAAPTVTNVGTAGTTNWQYVVTVVNSAGETTPSGIGVTVTGNAVLTGGNYNHIAWSAVGGAASYNVYRLVAGVFDLIGNTSGTSFNDTGGSATTPAPMSNTTMTLLDGGPLRLPILVLSAGYGVTFPAGSITIAAT
jgi:hypothetical protein